MSKYQKNPGVYSTLQSINSLSKPYAYYEVYNILTNVMNYSWRKGNSRPPKFLRQRLEEDRIVFKNFLEQLTQAKFVIVYIDEWSFNPSTLPWYSWMKKGTIADKIIRSTTDRYTVFDAVQSPPLSSPPCNFGKILVVDNFVEKKLYWKF